MKSAFSKYSANSMHSCLRGDVVETVLSEMQVKWWNWTVLNTKSAEIVNSLILCFSPQAFSAHNIIIGSSSSLSAIRVVSAAYLRLLIFLLAILIPAPISFVKLVILTTLFPRNNVIIQYLVSSIPYIIQRELNRFWDQRGVISRKQQGLSEYMLGQTNFIYFFGRLLI